MKYTGNIWKFGDDMDTDLIIPARYLTTTDPNILGGNCMEDADPDFVGKIQRGDIIVAGKNFGCGSSREHAPIAIKAVGISCVIAKSFPESSFGIHSMGLPIFESPDLWDRVADGDSLLVDGDEEWVKTKDGTIFSFRQMHPFMRELMNDGGLIAHIAKGRTK